MKTATLMTISIAGLEDVTIDIMDFTTTMYQPFGNHSPGRNVLSLDMYRHTQMPHLQNSQLALNPPTDLDYHPCLTYHACTSIVL
jgi:hypothetical protein